MKEKKKFKHGEVLFYVDKTSKKVLSIKYNAMCVTHKLMVEWDVLYKSKEEAQAQLNIKRKNKYEIR